MSDSESYSSESSSSSEEKKKKKKKDDKKSKKKDDKKSKKKDSKKLERKSSKKEFEQKGSGKDSEGKKKKASSSSSPSTKNNKDADSDLEDGVTPLVARNPDGSIYKSPLKFWTNKPAKLNQRGAKVIMKPNQGTDAFCRSEDNLTDTPCFYWHKFDGDFNVLVKIKGNFKSNYDKAGIMLRQDEKNWVLSGLEFFGGKICFSTCITRGITDWSLAPVPDEKVIVEKGIWIAIKRQEGRVVCFYSHDLQEWIQTRMGVFDADETLKVGVAATCPNRDPYKVVFERFSIQAM